jgi:hypothetical protein
VSASAPNPIQSPSSGYRARLRLGLTRLAGARVFRSSDAASPVGLAASAKDPTMTVHAMPAFCSAMSNATPRPKSAIDSA